MSKTSLNLKTLLEGELAKGYDFRNLREKFLNKEEALKDLEKIKDVNEKEFALNYLEYLINEDEKVLEYINTNHQEWLIKINEKFKTVINYKIDLENELLEIKFIDGNIRKMPLAM